MKKLILASIIFGNIVTMANAVDKLDITENKDGSITKTVTTLGGKLDSFTRTHLEAYGETDLSNGTITHDLLISGNLAFNNLKVQGNSSINGDLHGNHGTFRNMNIIGKVNLKDAHILGELKITGPVKITESKLYGKTNIIGKLTAQDTHFSDNLTVTSSKVKLKNSSLSKDIYIKNMHNSEAQTLYIDRNSVIRGMIKFESNAGIVVDESGKIRAVQIKGGSLEAR